MWLKKNFARLSLGVKKNKGILVGLAVLQILTIILTIFTAIFFQLKIFTDAQNIIAPIQGANFNADSIKAGQPFMENVVAVQQSYTSLISNLKQFFIALVGIFLFLQAGLWILSHRLFKKFSLKDAGKQWVKFVGASAIVLIPFAYISFTLLKNKFTVEVDPFTVAETAKTVVYVFFALYYVLLVAFASINIRRWQDFAQVVLRRAFVRIYYSAVVLVINLAVLFVPLYFMDQFLNQNNMWGTLLAMLIFMILMVLTRLFWIASLQNEKSFA